MAEAPGGGRGLYRPSGALTTEKSESVASLPGLGEQKPPRSHAERGNQEPGKDATDSKIATIPKGLPLQRQFHDRKPTTETRRTQRKPSRNGGGNYGSTRIRKHGIRIFGMVPIFIRGLPPFSTPCSPCLRGGPSVVVLRPWLRTIAASRLFSTQSVTLTPSPAGASFFVDGGRGRN